MKYTHNYQPERAEYSASKHLLISECPPGECGLYQCDETGTLFLEFYDDQTKLGVVARGRGKTCGAVGFALISWSFCIKAKGHNAMPQVVEVARCARDAINSYRQGQRPIMNLLLCVVIVV